MSISDKSLDEFIALYKKEGKEFKDRDEARRSAQNLVNLFKHLHEGSMEELQRQEKLKSSPQGFAIDSNGRTCSLCKRSVVGQIWYDKWGMKCVDCHSAFKKKIIPGYVFKDDKNERHITADKLSWKFGIHNQAIKKLVRNGTLKARVVKSSTYSDTIVFMKRDNPDLPSLIASHIKPLKNSA
jgi:protein-arginine kinase activator protein McsA